MTAIEHPSDRRQHAKLEWGENGTPISCDFDDPYFSLADGVAETRHVFIRGNNLSDRLCPGFQIAELGFGTGLNLAVLASMTPDDCPVNFTSFEAFPVSGTSAQRAYTALEGRDLNPEYCDAICQALQEERDQFQIGPIAVEIVIGDARERLPNWSKRANAWFLDGFSPAKNPEMWGHELMQEVGRHTADKGTFATFTAAGAIRRSLSEAGFDVERTAGYGRKRHMSRGTKR